MTVVGGWDSPARWDVGTFADDGNLAMQVTRSYDPDLRVTVLAARWPDGCGATYRLTDETVAYFGTRAFHEAVRNMMERHRLSHQTNRLSYDHATAQYQWVENVRTEAAPSLQPAIRRYCPLEG